MPSPGSEHSLLNDFPPPGMDSWLAEAKRLLKGASFDKVLRTPLPEDIVLEPIYRREDLPETEALDEAPGSAPFLRGSRPWRRPAWWIAQEQEATELQEAAATIRSELSRGLQVVHLVLDEGDSGGNRRPTTRLAVETAAELDALLQTAALEATPVFLQAGAHSLEPLALLAAVARRRGLDPSHLQGAIGADPLGSWARRGRLSAGLDAAFDQLASTVRWCEAHAPGLGAWWCHGEVWHEAGADAVQELGLNLACVADSLRQLQERGIEPRVAAHHLRWSFAVASTFFTEVAKLRIARSLLFTLLDACGAGEEAAVVRMHVSTSHRTKSLLDPHTNLLRSATEAFSAAIGGADSIHVDGFTRLDTVNDSFARRLARFQQIILREEAHLGGVLDPAGGSWYIERLGWELGRRAWSFFQEVEKEGGLRQALRSGWVQKRIHDKALRRRDDAACGRRVLVGVNGYPPPEGLAAARTQAADDERRPEATTGPADTGLAGTTGTPAADDAARQQRPDGFPPLPLDFSQATSPLALAERVVDAAAAGATLASIDTALRALTVGDDGEEIAALEAIREARDFEVLRAATGKARSDGVDLSVFVLTLQAPASFMARFDFTVAFFQTGGFETIVPHAPDDLEATMEEATRRRAFVTVLCGSDASYGEHAEDCARRLKASHPEGVVALAGAVADEELRQRLQAAGVEFFIERWTNRIELLGELARRKGVKP